MVACAAAPVIVNMCGRGRKLQRDVNEPHCAAQYVVNRHFQVLFSIKHCNSNELN